MLASTRPFSSRCRFNEQRRRNDGRAKGGNADGKGNFVLMNCIYKVVDVNPQISKPRNSCNAEIKNLYAVVTISLQTVDNKWFTMLRSMIRFRPHIYIYKVYFIPLLPPLPPAPLERGQGGKTPLRPPFRCPCQRAYNLVYCTPWIWLSVLVANFLNKFDEPEV